MATVEQTMMKVQRLLTRHDPAQKMHRQGHDHGAIREQEQTSRTAIALLPVIGGQASGKAQTQVLRDVGTRERSQTSVQTIQVHCSRSPCLPRRVRSQSTP